MKEISLIPYPDENSLLDRGPYKGLLIQNKLAIPDGWEVEEEGRDAARACRILTTPLPSLSFLSFVTGAHTPRTAHSACWGRRISYV
jgi:hypothetical protein